MKGMSKWKWMRNEIANMHYMYGSTKDNARGISKFVAILIKNKVYTF